jgi:hypothetical protein
VLLMFHISRCIQESFVSTRVVNGSMSQSKLLGIPLCSPQPSENNENSGPYSLFQNGDAELSMLRSYIESEKTASKFSSLPIPPTMCK